MSEAQQWVIDSIEEGVAAIELPNGEMIQLPAAMLPAGAKQGQVLSVAFAIDAGATKRARRASKAQTKQISDASHAIDPGGDVAL